MKFKTCISQLTANILSLIDSKIPSIIGCLPASLLAGNPCARAGHATKSASICIPYNFRVAYRCQKSSHTRKPNKKLNT